MYFCGIKDCDTWCEDLNRHYESGEHDLIVRIRELDNSDCQGCRDLKEAYENLETIIKNLKEENVKLRYGKSVENQLHPFKRMR